MPDKEALERVEYKLLDALLDREEVERIWKPLLAKSTASFFLSWEWISTWLETLPGSEKVDLIVGYANDEPVLAYFLGRRRFTRRSFFRYRLAALNSTGDEYLDELTIEYNGVLVIPQFGTDVIQEIINRGADEWDELYLPGLTGGLCAEIDHLRESVDPGFIIEVETDSSSHYVELDKVRNVSMDYAGLLSSNRRQQIRRSIREYNKNGEIRIDVAQTAGEALQMLEALAELHQREWIQRGKEGAFANSYFRDFHSSLVRKYFDSGVIQLIHIYTDQTTIGYLYNFIQEGDVLFYQCGFNYTGSSHARPGLVSHYFAVLLNAELGHEKYDFLAGDSQYKKSLATNAERMIWVRLKKKSIRSWIEGCAYRTYRKLKRTR
ncbi:GNAT family N-acetyltransferase [Thiolapillus sp.]